VIDRREYLIALGAALLLGGGAGAAATRGEPFSWDRLRALGRRVARAKWRPPHHETEAHGVDYDAAGQIAYREDRSLWGDSDGFAVRFFPLNRAAPTPVDIFVVEGGRARPFRFSPTLFTLTEDKAGKTPRLLPGFGGLRVMNPGGIGDWLAFQGASYFRSAGALDQYGLSARGLAIDTGIGGQEEFPIFTRFWLERGPGEAITIYALLDGPSVVGVWRFVNRRGTAGVTQDVTCEFWLRRDVARLGVAPLTSMFWYGEGNRRQGIDWRPEIHDSDGLALWTGAGERLWRPLANPPAPVMNSFADHGPRGFGLFQRDRDFDHYQDDSAYYEKRPNLWVEPQGDWGEGAVMLYEIPTIREYEDNIVAFWTPAAAAQAGGHYALGYRLRWIGGDPAPTALAQAVDCWTGTAGPPGTDPIPGAARLVADFVGEALAGLSRTSGVEPVVSVTGGRLISAVAYPVVGVARRWRLIVDVALGHGRPADLRAYLKRGPDALSETLLYQLPGLT